MLSSLFKTLSIVWHWTIMDIGRDIYTANEHLNWALLGTNGAQIRHKKRELFSTHWALTDLCLLVPILCLKKSYIYFEKVWVNSDLCYWFTGATYAPTNNCGLEAVNAVLKNEETQRVRFSIRRFLTKMVTIVRHWAFDSEEPLTTKSITTKQFQKGWVYLNSKPTWAEVGLNLFAISPEENSPKKFDDAVEKRIYRQWETFEDYQRNCHEVYVAGMDDYGWRCSCQLGIKRKVSTYRVILD